MLTKSTVATVVLSELKLIATPAIARPYSSKAWEVNGVDCPAVMPFELGEIVTVVMWPGQFPNGTPFTRKPGEKVWPFAPEAAVCCTNAPVISGERVSDWLLSPSNPVLPP